MLATLDAEAVDMGASLRQALLVAALLCQGAAASPVEGDEDLLEAVGSLPLGWYLVTQSDVNRAIDDARTSLISSCMGAYGFEYASSPYAPDLDFLGKRYGVSPEVADEIGFESLDTLQVPPGGLGGVVDDDTSDPEYQLALYGTSSEIVTSASGDSYDLGSGCLASATVELFGGLDSYADYSSLDVQLQQIDLDARARALASSSVMAMLEDWSQCMGGRGYQVGNRDELLNTDWPEPRPSAEERATAVADSECLIQVDYRETLISAEAVAQSELVEASGLSIEAFREQREALLDRARRLLIEERLEGRVAHSARG